MEDGATKYAELCHKSLKENEQLRTKNNAYIQDIEVFKEENTHLKLENEQLKSDAKYWGQTAESRLKEIDKLRQRNKRLEEKIQRERTSFTKTRERWSKEAENKIKELSEENEQLKSDNKWLLICVKNQSVIINELDSIIMAYNMEHKIVIKLTEKDLKTLDEALSYYTHGRCGE